MGSGYINLPIDGVISPPSAGSVTSNGVMLSAVSAGTPGNVLTDNGSNWVSSPPAGGTSFDPCSGPVTIYEEFTAFVYPSTIFGQMDVLLAGTYAKDTPTSAEQNRWGIINFSDAVGTACGFVTDITDSYAGASTLIAAMAFQIGSNIPTDAGNSWVATWGLGNSFPIQPNGAYFSMNYLSPNFQCITYNGSTTTAADSGIPYAASTWYNFRVVSTAASCKFYIDGVLVQTITTNLPLGDYGAVYAAFTNQTGPGVIIRLDWAYAQFTPVTPRGMF